MPSTAQLQIVIKARDDASRALSGIGNKAQAMEKKFRPMGMAAGAALAGIGIAAIKMGADFESSMAEVWTLMPQMSEKAFGSLKKDVLGFSKEMGIATDKVVPALYQAISAGVPPDNVLDFMKTAAKASIGGVTDLETAVDGITSVVNAYGKSVIGAQEAADIMFTGVRLGKTTFDELSASLFQVTPIAAAAGVDFRQVTAALAALTAQGVPTAVAATQLKEAITSLSAPTQSQSKLAKELGLEFSAQHLQAVGLSGAFAELYEATGGNMEQMRKLVGSSEALKAVLALAGNQAYKFEDAQLAMANSAGAADEAFKKVDDTVARQLQVAMNNIKVTLTELGVAVLPTVSKALDGVSATMAFLAEHKTLTLALATAIGTVLVAAFVAWTASMVTALAVKVALMWEIYAIIAAIAALGVAVMLLVKNWDAVWGALKRAPAGLLKWLKDNWVKALIALFVPGALLFMLIKENWSKLFKILPRPVQEFAVVVAGIFDKVGNSIVDMINWVIGKLNDLMAAAKNVEKAWTWAGIPGLPSIAIPTITAELDIAGAMRGAMEKSGPGLMDAWSDLLGGMLDRAGEMGKAMRAAVDDGLNAPPPPSVPPPDGAAAEEAMADLGQRLSATFTEELLAGLEGLPPHVMAVISQAGEAIEQFSASFRPAIEQVFIGINELAVLGPDVPASYLAAQDAVGRLENQLGYLDAALRIQHGQAATLMTDLLGQQQTYDMLADAVQRYEDKLGAAQDALTYFASAVLAGTADFEQAAFDIEQAIAGIRLQIIELQEAQARDTSLIDNLARQQGIYDDLTASVQRYTDELGAARDALSRLANAQLAGTAEFEERAFEIQQAIARARLELLDLRAAGGTQEAIAALEAELARLRDMAERVRLEEQLALDPLRRQIEDLLDTTEELTFEAIIAGIREAQARIEDAEPSLTNLNDLLATQKQRVEDAEAALRNNAGAIKELEDEITRLGLEAEKVRLQEQLELDPLRRQIEDLLTPVEELTFQQIIDGIKGAQSEIALAEPTLEYLNKLLLTQEQRVADADAAHKDSQETIAANEQLYRDLAGALGTLEGALVSETDAALKEYGKLMFGTAVVQIYLDELGNHIVREFQPALNSIDTAAPVGQLNALTDAAYRVQDALGGLSGFGAAGLNVSSYQSGGTVPGPRGAAQLAIVHGGERITPAGGERGGGAGTTIIHRENFGRQNFIFPQVDPRAAMKEWDRQFRGF